jgi:hypothetical protein
MIQVIERWRRDRQRKRLVQKLVSLLSSGTSRRVYSLIRSAPDWTVQQYVSGRLGRGLRTFLRLYAASASPDLKEVTVNLSSTKRPWNSKLLVRIRLKW